MLKETIICIVIVVVISIGNIITQKYTKESVSQVNEKLESITENIRKVIDIDMENDENDESKELEEEIKSKVNIAKEEWQKRHDKLAYYIEHDELEKVDDKMVSLESNVNTKEYEQAVADLKEGIFFLDHIQEKYAFKLTNIF